MKKIYGLLKLLALCLVSLTVNANEKSILSAHQHQQLVLVITANWQADHGLLYTFEKINGSWKLRSKANQVTVGKNGLAWGLGLHAKQQGLYKQEGDGKAPAGIFELGSAFGYLKSLNTAMPYQAMSENDFCIDVNRSPYYNQIVDKSVVGEKAVTASTEPMRRDIHVNGDIRYKKGLVVKHNQQNIIGQGSCIFIHVWKAHGVPTSGCTAMAETVVDSLLAWLDVSKKPLYILLPQAQYIEKKQAWALPEVN
jgi:L,D-peptidoglycan transpeptidase YkuD (ErfK/YbiS/YcfS/YnhG family)